jgi:outer membrane protein
MKKKLIVSALMTALLGTSALAMAQQKSEEGNWLVRGRIVSLTTQQKNDDWGTGGNQDTLKVSNNVLPEFDISYFFTKNIAAELILALPQKHEVKMNGSSLGHFQQLPPTLTLQYHFDVTPQIKPYVGAGVTYLRTWGSDLDKNNLGVRANNFGTALQVGVDYKINKNWYLNADVKKIFIDVDVNDITAPTSPRLTSIHLNPLVAGVGVGYRF